MHHRLQPALVIKVHRRQLRHPPRARLPRHGLRVLRLAPVQHLADPAHGAVDQLHVVVELRDARQRRVVPLPELVVALEQVHVPLEERPAAALGYRLARLGVAVEKVQDPVVHAQHLHRAHHVVRDECLGHQRPEGEHPVGLPRYVARERGVGPRLGALLHAAVRYGREERHDRRVARNEQVRDFAGEGQRARVPVGHELAQPFQAPARGSPYAALDAPAACDHYPAHREHDERQQVVVGVPQRRASHPPLLIRGLVAVAVAGHVVQRRVHNLGQVRDHRYRVLAREEPLVADERLEGAHLDVEQRLHVRRNRRHRVDPEAHHRLGVLALPQQLREHVDVLVQRAGEAEQPDAVLHVLRQRLRRRHVQPAGPVVARLLLRHSQRLRARVVPLFGAPVHVYQLDRLVAHAVDRSKLLCDHGPRHRPAELGVGQEHAVSQLVINARHFMHVRGLCEALLQRVGVQLHVGTFQQVAQVDVHVLKEQPRLGGPQQRVRGKQAPQVFAQLLERLQVQVDDPLVVWHEHLQKPTKRHDQLLAHDIQQAAAFVAHQRAADQVQNLPQLHVLPRVLAGGARRLQVLDRRIDDVQHRLNHALLRQNRGQRDEPARVLGADAVHRAHDLRAGALAQQGRGHLEEDGVDRHALAALFAVDCARVGVYAALQRAVERHSVHEVADVRHVEQAVAKVDQVGVLRHQPEGPLQHHIDVQRRHREPLQVKHKRPHQPRQHSRQLRLHNVRHGVLADLPGVGQHALPHLPGVVLPHHRDGLVHAVQQLLEVFVLWARRRVQFGFQAPEKLLHVGKSKKQVHPLAQRLHPPADIDHRKPVQAGRAQHQRVAQRVALAGAVALQILAHAVAVRHHLDQQVQYLLPLYPARRTRVDQLVHQRAAEVHLEHEAVRHVAVAHQNLEDAKVRVLIVEAQIQDALFYCGQYHLVERDLVGEDKLGVPVALHEEVLEIIEVVRVNLRLQKLFKSFMKVLNLSFFPFGTHCRFSQFEQGLAGCRIGVPS
ncbi:NmrA family transcriptional regulator [Babesia caballi]|uniref:NmrA family transcriptional regulator n=1 Tax=Babesia caballi TaxID=5871 RepID=A0AAV4LLW5_BABCB|nr:NmrA family transcriptional regulator [Babesia caballi]